MHVEEQHLPLRGSESIQGNILAGFRKDHQVFVFLTIPDERAGRAYVAELVPRDPTQSRIASTRQVADFNETFSAARRGRGGDDPESLVAVWVNLAVTAPGLRKLLGGWRGTRRFPAFSQGAGSRAKRLRDTGRSAPKHWLIGRDDQAIDLVLTVAADREYDLALALQNMRATAARHGLTTVFEQPGQTLPGARAGHEHFGFKDGISQPGVVGFDRVGEDGDREGHPGDEMVEPGEFVLGYKRSGGAPSWPHPKWMADGSFQVFRRLRQDVPGWWSQVTRRAESLPANNPMTPDLLAAKFVGRWRSGTPLARAQLRDNRSAQDARHDNDFTFKGDRRGYATPRFAHIRKMYPRDDRFGDDRRRILRRGIPYGPEFDPTDGRGHGVDADRGLLFNAFMSNIEQQFEFLQRAWANNPKFPGNVFGDHLTDGPDPVIGHDDCPVTLRRKRCPDELLNLRRFVDTSGAVYAFAPSIDALRRIGAGRRKGRPAPNDPSL